MKMGEICRVLCFFWMGWRNTFYIYKCLLRNAKISNAFLSHSIRGDGPAHLPPFLQKKGRMDTAWMQKNRPEWRWVGENNKNKTHYQNECLVETERKENSSFPQT